VDPALRVDLEYRCHARQHSLASVRGRIELEPRNVIRVLPGAWATTLAPTALPSVCSQFGASVMAPDRLAFEPERRCRSRRVQASLRSLPALHSYSWPLRRVA